jgi:transposase
MRSASSSTSNLTPTSTPEKGAPAPALAELAQLDEAALRALAQSLIERIAADAKQSTQLIEQQRAELLLRQTKIDALTHEIRVLRHFRFAAKAEAMDGPQAQLFAEANEEDLAAAQERLDQLCPPPRVTTTAKTTPKRQALPAHLPRIDVLLDPQNTDCGCGAPMQRIGQDVSERLDYVPGTFSVQRHIRGVWVCKCCEHMRQEAMPAQIIEGGIPTAALLAQVMVAKYDDHLPLYRQSEIYARSGVELARSTLSAWVGQCGVALSPIVQALKRQLLQSAVLHADESPITVLDKGGKKGRGYIWAYASGQHEKNRAVVFEIKAGRSGQYARDFLVHEREGPPGLPGQADKPELGARRWAGHLMVDDYAGYKALFVQASTLPAEAHAGAAQAAHPGVIVEVGCWAHVRRKFFELHVASKSTLAHTAVERIGQLYGIERAIVELGLNLEQATEYRQQHAKPLLAALHEWLQAQRQVVPDGSASAKAFDYTLKRWPALVRYADNAQLPMDNNRIENQIRPWALGRKNWLFAGSPQAGERAADIMSLIQTAKMNEIEPLAYLTDVLKRLPTQPNSRIEELLPTRWKPQSATGVAAPA